MEEFLYKKYKYDTLFINNKIDLDSMYKTFNEEIDNINFLCYDTETTGLDVINDKPFLIIFGFNKHVYYWLAENHNATKLMFDICKESGKYLFAHNAKYDYHMLYNNNDFIPDNVKLADTITMMRLTETADNQYYSMKLSKLGTKYIDETAKFASDLIQKELNAIRAERKKILFSDFKLVYGWHLKDCNDKKKHKEFDKYIEKEWLKFYEKVNYITDYNKIFDNYKEPNYYDVFLKNKNLLINYAIDDIVIMLEALPKMMNIYCQRYNNNGKVNNDVFFRESKLIPLISKIERQGFVVDIDYLKKSYDKLILFKNEAYAKFHKLIGINITVSQHLKIRDYFNEKYKLNLSNFDKKVVKNLCRSDIKEVREIAQLISKLRTVDKWLSTYVIGILNKIKYDGEYYKLYTTINNNGAVSGRVASDLQQMPKNELNGTIFEDDNEFMLIDSMCINDKELFKPRRMIIPSKDYVLYYEDYSQLELRIQANYTIMVGKPDINLCRAYMPYNCYRLSGFEKILFDHNKSLDYEDYKWYKNENNELWHPTDLHDATAFKAFPNLSKNDDDFKKKRGLAKATNFGSIYGIGIRGLQDMLDIDYKTANDLINGFKETFPGIKYYNQYVNNQLILKGYVENIYGRRYYIEDSSNYYKASNYLIQGTGADMLKEIEIKVIEYLSDKKSRFIIPIHDELCLEVHKDEESFVPIEVKKIMEDVKDKIKFIPIKCEIEKTSTNWAEKEGV